MQNLESFENFKNEEIQSNEAIMGGKIIPCTWTDGEEVGRDVYDTETNRVVYL
jgi:hypothetical protein